MAAELRIGITALMLALVLSISSQFSLVTASSSPQNLQILNAERRVSLFITQFRIISTHTHTLQFRNQLFIQGVTLISVLYFELWTFWLIFFFFWQIDLTSHIIKVFLTLKVRFFTSCWIKIHLIFVD